MDVFQFLADRNKTREELDVQLLHVLQKATCISQYLSILYVYPIHALPTNNFETGLTDHFTKCHQLKHNHYDTPPYNKNKNNRMNTPFCP